MLKTLDGVASQIWFDRLAYEYLTSDPLTGICDSSHNITEQNREIFQ